MKPITIRLPPAMNSEIESMMAARLDAPEKSDVVRELIAIGLAHSPRKKTGKA